jgi:hypothetical protein
MLEEVNNCGELVQKHVNPSALSEATPPAGEPFARTTYPPAVPANTPTNDCLRSFFDYLNPAQSAGRCSRTVAPTQSFDGRNFGP